MDFNIKHLLDKKFPQRNSTEKEIVSIVQKYLPDLQTEDVHLVRGILSFKNISPTQKTHIKLHKKDILKNINNKNIFVRDIM